MTVLRSALMAREGFEHGFGTARSALEDYPENVHILLQVHGERIVVLTENASAVANAHRPASDFALRATTDKMADRGRTSTGLGTGRTQDVGGELKEREVPEVSGIWNLGSGIAGDNVDVKIQNLPASQFQFDKGDALVSNIPGVTMGIRTADCLPLLIGDRIRGTAAAVHCGWRSLAWGLAGKVVEVLSDVMGSRVEHLLAAIGPSIGPCCYKVGEDVEEVFSAGRRRVEGLFEKRGQSLYMDLASGVKTQLIMEGMAPEMVDEIAGCTSCNPDLFWSWRAREDNERMVSFITAREPYS